MLKYDNTVSSTIDGKPIYGAQVSVFTAEDPNNPTLASLYADEAGTIALSQPILTDQLGYFAFYIPDGKYDIRVMTGVVEISRTNITMVDTLSLKNRALVVPQNEDSGTLPPAGERAGKLLAFDNAGLPQMAVPNSFEGPTGPANSTYTTLAGLKAAGVTNRSYNLAAAGGADGGVANGPFEYRTGDFTGRTDVVPLDGVPITSGALVRSAPPTNPQVLASGAVDVLATQMVSGQQVFPSRVNVHAFDDAAPGTAGINPNPNFSGTPPTGYTLVNFAKASGGVAATAGSTGSVSIDVTVQPNRLYQLPVTFTTTAYGGIALSVGGVPILNTNDFSYYEPGTYTINLTYASRTTSGTVPLTLTKDASFAGTIASMDLIPPAREMPQDFVAVPSDNKSFSNPYALKHGRNEQGNQIWGDRLAGSMLGPASAWNIGIGPRTLAACVNGQENVAIGAFALQHFIGEHTTAGGYGALGYLTIGARNTAWGYKAGQYVSMGNDNSQFGHMANFVLTTGNANGAFGQQANYYNRRGSRNNAVGNQALLNNDGGSGNTAVGDQAGPLTSGTNTFAWDYTTFLGAESKAYGARLLVAGALGRVGSDPNAGGVAVTDAMLVGPGGVVAASESVGVGNNVTIASGAMRSTITGVGAKATAEYGTGYGYLSEVGLHGTAFGYLAKAKFANSSAFGFGATADKANQLVFGNADNDEFVFGGVVVTKAKLIALLATVP